MKIPFIQKRLEFFKTYTEEMSDNFLLQTIRIPKNLVYLTDRLPQANYEKYNKKSILGKKDLPDINLNLGSKNLGVASIVSLHSTNKKKSKIIAKKALQADSELTDNNNSSIHQILKHSIEEGEKKKKNGVIKSSSKLDESGGKHSETNNRGKNLLEAEPIQSNNEIITLDNNNNNNRIAIIKSNKAEGSSNSI